ncbi:hypothetical protein CIB48_g4251 [Xylaria polymorpha]|nr:hypothetical protein CIB48_g4251 [Xylaria polymorpha]
MADAVQDVDAKASSLDTAKDLFAGAVGGVAQVLIGQPFDIVKVRLQTTTQYRSALDAATTIYAKEGPLAFYKGTLTPLLGIGACVSIQFGAFGYAKRYFETANAARALKKDLGYGQYYTAGAFAGVANSVISGPIEHRERRRSGRPLPRRGRHDPPRGAGLRLVVPGLEWMMNADAARNGIARNEVPAYKVALYGGLAGEALWLGSYPFDVVKSKMQTDGFGANMRYKSMRDCFAQTWRAEGMRGFWKGIGPTLLRAMPVSAGTFAVVEATMRAIS